MKAVKKIIDKLEECNIQVYPYTEDKKLLGYELNTYTDGGVNQLVFLDFKDWKETLEGIFSTDTKAEKEFERVKSKLESLLEQMQDIVEDMPSKGSTSSECQRMTISIALNELDHCINGIELEDFITDENYEIKRRVQRIRNKG